MVESRQMKYFMFVIGLLLIPAVVCAEDADIDVRLQYPVTSTGNTIASGLHSVPLGGSLILVNRGGVPPLTNITVTMLADNITNVGDPSYAQWTRSSAQWSYPSNFTVAGTYRINWNTDINATTDLPVTFSRTLNTTTFAQDGYQQVTCQVTFWNLTNLYAIWGEVDNYKRDKVNVTVLANTFSSDLPDYTVISSTNRSYQFEMNGNNNNLIVGHPYTFSVVLKIDRINQTETVEYSPKCGMNLITNIALTNPPGPNQSVSISEPELPPTIHYVSVSSNNSINWGYWSHYQRSAILAENSGIVQNTQQNVTRGVALFRPSARQFIFNTVPVIRTTFGLSTDIPITGDWNGDNVTDVGVFRPSARQFIFNTAPLTRTTFGLSTDIPITGDWDGDGRTDIGVFRPSTRQFIFNTAPITRTTFGLSTDIPVTGDWDGDGITDIGVFRPSTRQFIFNTAPITRTTFGLSTDIPITGDWNGDTITDIGVFRPSARQFIFNTSPITRTTFGLSTDKPITGKWV